MLRAARVLKELDSVNTANGIVIQQYAQQIEILQNLLKESDESLHEARRQIELLGRAGGDTGGSNSGCEGGIQAEGPDPLPN